MKSIKDLIKYCKEIPKENWDTIGNYLCLVLIGVGTILGIPYLQKKMIPISKGQVQKGYIPTSNLEIKCEDLDGNGEFETIIEINKIPYLLKEINGKPKLFRYEIKDVEINY